MNLFELENNVVTFSPQALLIAPFKEIWDKDKTKDKHEATLKLGFIYYMSDERSDFIHILDTDERIAEIKLFIDMPKNFTGKTKEIIRAVHYYEKMSETTSTNLLQSTRLVLQKISKFLDDVNLDERDERTKKPIHDIGKITSSVEKIPRLIKAINEIEKQVIKEKAIKAQSGTRTESMFEDEDI
ncbi:hypothetical protein [Clostridium sp.]|jgi:hypothetical protein|uniref:hypothetical protein n=1 Tax=Clostridium sp. TaxID=1506 RepID=UPI003EEAAD56